MRFRGDRYNALMLAVLAALGVILVAILVYYFVFAPK
jgi:hypothetical protein